MKKDQRMKCEPVPSYVETVPSLEEGVADRVVGWKNAFGTFVLEKGITRRVGDGIERSKR